MTTLHQLNERVLFSSDAAGHLLSLILIYISMEQMQQRTIRALRGWGHVSSRSFGALLANPFIPARGILYSTRLINVKMSRIHVWCWKPYRRQDAGSVRLFECKKKFRLVEGRVTGWRVQRGRRGRLFIFHSWHISLGGPLWCSKKPCISVM